jgi:phage minor structural protein
MLKLLDGSRAMVALLTQFKDLSIESDLATADKLISFKLPKTAISRALLQQEYFLQSETDEYVIKEINFSDKDFYEVFGKLNVDNLRGKAYLTYETESVTLEANLSSVLTGTGWSYQLVDTSTKLRMLRLTNVSVHQIILECCAVYGCEVWFDTLSKTARIYTQRGMDRGAYVYSELNLRDSDYQSDTYDLVTRLYPYGKDGLSIASVNGGLEYIDNTQFTGKIIERKWIDERYTSAQALYDDAVTVLDVLSRPRVAFRVDVLNLVGSRPEYSILDFQLGDWVRIFDKTNQFTDIQRIVRLVEYPLTPEKNKADFSNSPIKYSGNSSKQIADLSQILSSTKAELSEAIDQVTVLVTNGENGNVILRYDEENQPYEILIMDTADINTATRVWRWNLSGLSYSATGYNGPYTTAITMDGQIVANFITTGTLSAERIAAHSLTADKLVAGTITAESGVIADLAITTAKIAIGAITTALIETGAVETAQIADGSITDAKIVGLTASKITAGTIDAANINVINLNADNLTVGTINGQRIADGAISAEKLAAGAVTAEKVAVGAITADHLMNGSITSEKIADGSIKESQVNWSTHLLF